MGRISLTSIHLGLKVKNNNYVHQTKVPICFQIYQFHNTGFFFKNFHFLASSGQENLYMSQDLI